MFTVAELFQKQAKENQALSSDYRDTVDKLYQLQSEMKSFAYRILSFVDNMNVIFFECDHCHKKHVISSSVSHTVECECGKKWRTSTDKCVRSLTTFHVQV